MPILPAELAALLSVSTVLESIERQVLEVLAEDFEIRVVASREVLIRQGSRDESLYLVLSGEFSVTATGRAGSEQHLTSLGPGRSFGGWSLLTGTTASAEAVRCTGCVSVSLARCA